MKIFFLTSLLFLTLIFGCNKDGEFNIVTNECTHPTPTKIPPKGYIYATTYPLEVTYQQSHCGFLPLGKKNYWVYRDSSFDRNTGQFLNTYIDTLRFEKTYRGTDSIVWWSPNPYSVNFPPYYKGYPDFVYSTDTVLYTISWSGGVGGTPTAKWLTAFNTDSIHTGQHWDDTGGSLETFGYKFNPPITVPAGVFENCYFYKLRFGYGNNNRGIYIYVKPGVGIIQSKSIGGATGNILTNTSTLLNYHIE